jgi:hypothetical protein
MALYGEGRMKETILIEKEKIKLRRPILVEGLPGLGRVGAICVRYLIEKLQAKKFAKLYSPHFPYYVIADFERGARLLCCDFYYWINDKPEGPDLILLVGDAQAQTIEGQYDVASKILDFAQRHGIELLITVGGFSTTEEGVVVIANDCSVLRVFQEIGAKPSPAGSPVVGMAGLLLGLAELRGVKAACLLGKTLGHLPDVSAARSVLRILSKFLRLEIDLDDLTKEEEKISKFMRRVRELETKIRPQEEVLERVERLRTTYIA